MESISEALARALAHRRAGQFAEAERIDREVLALVPSNAEAWSGLGTALEKQSKLEEAEHAHRRAAELLPWNGVAQYNLGAVLHAQGKSDAAILCFRQALQLKPNLAEAHLNYGSLRHAAGALKEAADCYRRALELKPDLAEAHYNHAVLMLQHGDFERGWQEYEWRWKCDEFKAQELKQSAWDGSPVAGAVLLHGEQGLGDILQFVRYAPLVKQRAGRVLLRCDQQLIPLLSRCRGIDRILPADAEIPPHDAETFLIRLPRAMYTTLATVPCEVPYLFADPLLIERWQSRLPPGRLRIGIAWQGNPQYKHDANRSIPLTAFAPLAEVDGVQLISLQHGHGVEQLTTAKDHFAVWELPSDIDTVAGTFMDTAAVIMNLDLVITSDTAIAHLAGGLGVPVWVALSHAAEWRWLLSRSDSPWYPTMKLFRQTSTGSWTGVFEQMKAELQNKVAANAR